MGTSQTDIEEQVIELATDSFNTFCEDIAGMFGVNMQCEQKEVLTDNVSGLKNRFSKLVAVNIVDSKGVMDGTFHVLFDQEGLFTIGGVIVMLPEKRIMENRESATCELAASMVDAVGEAGNLLVGSWDRVFRDGLKKHGHFLQRLPAFIGKPWNNSEEKIGLSSEEDFTVALYEMTIASYPPFTCGVIFPKEMLGSESGSASNKEPATEKESEAKADKENKEAKPSPKKAASGKNAKAKDSNTEAQAKESDEEEKPAEESDAEEAPEQVQAKDEKAQAKAAKKTKSPKPAAKKAGKDKSSKAKKATSKKDASPQPEAEEASDEQTHAEDIAEEVETQQTAEETVDNNVQQDQAPEENDGEESQSQEATESAEQDTEEPQAEISEEATEEKPAENPRSEKPARGKISEAIRKMAQSPAVLPGESNPMTATGELFALCAGDIMQADVIWAEPEESVQQALSKMQQNDTGYILIGRDGVLEGIASRSDVTGAISPYLRSVFAKWRRPLDVATLNIKVKWIMSRPVRTVRPDTSLAAVMEHMCRFGGRAIPVVDEEGHVQGLITVFDILQMLLQTGAGISTAGKTPQEPPMV